MGMDPNTVVLHHQSIVSPRFGRCAITLLETAKPITHLMILVVSEFANARNPDPQLRENAKLSVVAGKQTKGKGATSALVDGSKQPECFKPIAPLVLQKASGASSIPGSHWVSFSENYRSEVPGATQWEPRWHMVERPPWDGGGRSSGLATEAKPRMPDLPVFPRSVPRVTWYLLPSIGMNTKPGYLSTSGEGERPHVRRTARLGNRQRLADSSPAHDRQRATQSPNIALPLLATRVA